VVLVWAYWWMFQACL